jgi:hypothetical protein
MYEQDVQYQVHLAHLQKFGTCDSGWNDVVFRRAHSHALVKCEYNFMWDVIHLTFIVDCPDDSRTNRQCRYWGVEFKDCWFEYGSTVLEYLTTATAFSWTTEQVLDYGMIVFVLEFLSFRP